MSSAHFILGLPGEDKEEILRQAEIISSLPIDILKLHQMQIIKGTPLAKAIYPEPAEGTPPPHIFTPDEYIDIISTFINRSRPDIIYERFVSQSPDQLLIAPKWGLKNYEFTNRLNNRLTNEKSH